MGTAGDDHHQGQQGDSGCTEQQQAEPAAGFDQAAGERRADGQAAADDQVGGVHQLAAVIEVGQAGQDQRQDEGPGEFEQQRGQGEPQ